MAVAFRLTRSAAPASLLAAAEGAGRFAGFPRWAVSTPTCPWLGASSLACQSLSSCGHEVGRVWRPTKWSFAHGDVLWCRTLVPRWPCSRIARQRQPWACWCSCSERRALATIAWIHPCEHHVGARVRHEVACGNTWGARGFLWECQGALPIARYHAEPQCSRGRIASPQHITHAAEWELRELGASATSTSMVTTSAGAAC